MHFCVWGKVQTDFLFCFLVRLVDQALCVFAECYLKYNTSDPMTSTILFDQRLPEHTQRLPSKVLRCLLIKGYYQERD